MNWRATNSEKVKVYSCWDIGPVITRSDTILEGRSAACCVSHLSGTRSQGFFTQRSQDLRIFRPSATALWSHVRVVVVDPLTRLTPPPRWAEAQSTQDARRNAKEMEPVDVNGSVHTARKQHQRKNVPICMRVMSRVLCGLGLTVVT